MLQCNEVDTDILHHLGRLVHEVSDVQMSTSEVEQRTEVPAIATYLKLDVNQFRRTRPSRSTAARETKQIFQTIPAAVRTMTRTTTIIAFQSTL